MIRARGNEAVRTCSFMRFLRAPVPTLMILLENSTPIVWEESTRHSFFTKRWRRQDLWLLVSVRPDQVPNRYSGRWTS